MTAARTCIAAGIAGWALLHAAPAKACNGWQIGQELSLRHASGWTLLQVRQDGDRISGTARRTGPGGGGNVESGGTVQGRMQPQRIWLKVSWPGGSEIFDGSISPDGDASGTHISEDGRQDGTAWEAIEPLGCASSPMASAGANQAAPQGATELDEFTRAAKDIIGALRGDKPSPASDPFEPGAASPAIGGTDDPFTEAPSDGSDPFQETPAYDQAGSHGGTSGGQSDGGWSDFDPSQMDGSPQSNAPAPQVPSGGSAGGAPASSFEESGAGTAKTGSAKQQSGSSMPILIVPIGKIDDRCAAGYVWREARSSDHVCVTPAARDRVKGENHFARLHRDTEGLYGCKPGYVWREAYSGDRTCVTPGARDLAAEENRLGPTRKISN